MGMYNLIFGSNPRFREILDAIGLRRRDLGRYRDVWVEQTGKNEYRVAVYTRNGGGNRQHWGDEYGVEGEACTCTGCIITHRLPKHELYLSDEDGSFDSTYATVYFRLPTGNELVEAMAIKSPINMDELWKQSLDNMKKGERPDVEAELMKVIDAALSGKDMKGKHFDVKVIKGDEDEEEI